VIDGKAISFPNTQRDSTFLTFMTYPDSQSVFGSGITHCTYDTGFKSVIKSTDNPMTKVG